MSFERGTFFLITLLLILDEIFLQLRSFEMRAIVIYSGISWRGEAAPRNPRINYKKLVIPQR